MAAFDAIDSGVHDMAAVGAALVDLKNLTDASIFPFTTKGAYELQIHTDDLEADELLIVQFMGKLITGGTEKKGPEIPIRAGEPLMHVFGPFVIGATGDMTILVGQVNGSVRDFRFGIFQLQA